MPNGGSQETHDLRQTDGDSVGSELVKREAELTETEAPLDGEVVDPPAAERGVIFTEWHDRDRSQTVIRITIDDRFAYAYPNDYDALMADLNAARRACA